MRPNLFWHDLVAAAVVLFVAQPAAGDEGGVSFWLPGQFGSFGAVPGEPGWSLPLVYYHTSVDASGNRSFPRGGLLTAGLDVQADLIFAIPTYILAEPVLGGQTAISLAGLFGTMKVSGDVTLTLPGGGTQTVRQIDSLDGVGDLYPSFSLKWNRGVHNYMAYTMAGPWMHQNRIFVPSKSVDFP